MPVIGVTGNLSSGKTFIATLLCYFAILFAYGELSEKDMLKIKELSRTNTRERVKPKETDVLIRANYPLKMPNFKLITMDDILDLISKLENGEEPDLSNCIYVLDEIWSYLESRTSNAKVNRLLSYFVMQSAKSDVQIIYTAQLNSMADLRLRGVASMTISCYSTRKDDSFHYTAVSQEGWINRFKISKQKAVEMKLFELYDTTYKVPLVSLAIKKRMDELKQKQREEKAEERKILRKSLKR